MPYSVIEWQMALMTLPLITGLSRFGVVNLKVLRFLTAVSEELLRVAHPYNTGEEGYCS